MSHDHEPRHHPVRGIGTNPDQRPRVEGVTVGAGGVAPLAGRAGFGVMSFGGEPEPAAAAGNPNGWEILMVPDDGEAVS